MVKLVNVPTILNNIKATVDDLNVHKFKTVLIDLKKLRDVVDKKVVQNTKFNKLNTKVCNLEKKISENLSKQNLENKIEDVDKKYWTLVV